MSSAFGGRPVATTIRPPSRRRATSATISAAPSGDPGWVSTSASIPSARSASTRALSSAAALPTWTTTTLAEFRLAISRTIGSARSATAPSRVRITLRIELPP
jgi:hypothetical protein